MCSDFFGWCRLAVLCGLRGQCILLALPAVDAPSPPPAFAGGGGGTSGEDCFKVTPGVGGSGADDGARLRKAEGIRRKVNLVSLN